MMSPWPRLRCKALRKRIAANPPASLRITPNVLGLGLRRSPPPFFQLPGILKKNKNHQNSSSFHHPQTLRLRPPPPQKRHRPDLDIFSGNLVCGGNTDHTDYQDFFLFFFFIPGESSSWQVLVEKGLIMELLVRAVAMDPPPVLHDLRDGAAFASWTSGASNRTRFPRPDG